MNIHANAHDGLIHVHDCPEHPPHSTRGGLACFWDDHDITFRQKHRQAALDGVTAMLKLTPMGGLQEGNLTTTLARLKKGR